MRKPFRCDRLPGFFLLLLIPLFFSCRGSPAITIEAGSPETGGIPADKPEDNPDDKPADSSWDSPEFSPPDQPLSPEPEAPQDFSSMFEVAPGVGIFTRDPRDPALKLEAEERERISLSFRAAYAEALGRGLPLDGVLGGDRVHAWPADSPLAWVQNWKTTEAYPNSWGLPDLVLAIRVFDDGEVFIVRGPILDAYGKSGGLGGANGVAGYGPPLSDEFPYGEGGDPDSAQGIIPDRAQRFGKGLMIVDVSGRAAFIPDEPPVPGESS